MLFYQCTSLSKHVFFFFLNGRGHWNFLETTTSTIHEFEKIFFSTPSELGLESCPYLAPVQDCGHYTKPWFFRRWCYNRGGLIIQAISIWPLLDRWRVSPYQNKYYSKQKQKFVFQNWKYALCSIIGKMFIPNTLWTYFQYEIRPFHCGYYPILAN